MKKYIALIVSVALILVGVIGTVVCFLPSSYGSAKVVEKYVSAVNNCNLEKADKYFLSAQDVYGDFLTSGDYDESDDAEVIDTSTKLGALKNSRLSIRNDIPEDAKSVKKIELIALNSNEVEGYLSLNGVSVRAVISVTYVDADDNEVSISDIQSFTVMKSGTSYKIVSF